MSVLHSFYLRKILHSIDTYILCVCIYIAHFLIPRCFQITLIMAQLYIYIYMFFNLVVRACELHLIILSKFEELSNSFFFSKAAILFYISINSSIKVLLSPLHSCDYLSTRYIFY